MDDKQDSWDIYSLTGLFRVKPSEDGYIHSKDKYLGKMHVKLRLYDEGNGPYGLYTGLLGYFDPTENEMGLQKGEYGQMDSTKHHEWYHKKHETAQEEEVRYYTNT